MSTSEVQTPQNLRSVGSKAKHDLLSPDGSTSSPESKRLNTAIDLELLSEKMDRVLSELSEARKEQQENAKSLKAVLALEPKFSSLDGEFKETKLENGRLREQVKCLDGRLVRAESEIKNLRESLTDLRTRQMKKNLVVNNYPEPDNNENYEETAISFLINEMKIPKRDVESKVDIDVAHRFGAGHPRPLVISFVSRRK